MGVDGDGLSRGVCSAQRCVGQMLEERTGPYGGSFCCGLCLRLPLGPPAALLDWDYLFSCDLTFVCFAWKISRGVFWTLEDGFVFGPHGGGPLGHE